MPMLANAQSWTRIHTPGDSLWAGSLDVYNLGDTLIYKAKTDASESTAAFYVSTNGGQTFSADTTKLATLAVNGNILYPLRYNKLILGFKTPNSVNGTYKFGGVNNWSSFLSSYLGNYAETTDGNLLLHVPSNNKFYTLTTQGTNLTNITGLDFSFRSYFLKGNRLLLGGQNGEIKIIDNANYAGGQLATMPAGITGSNNHVYSIFESGNALFAVVYPSGYAILIKSTDNGNTWTKLTPTYLKNGTATNINAVSIVGTPDGKIYFSSEYATTTNVLVSTDGGQTATPINTGLPSATGTYSRLFTSGNKVYFNYRKANSVDFVRVDTATAGIYVLNGGTTSVREISLKSPQLVIYPNPADNKLNVQTRLDLESFTVYDLTGKRVLSGKFNKEIDVTKLTSGQYIFHSVGKDGKIYTQSFLKK